MKTIAYVVVALGVLALIAGAVLKLTNHHHGLAALGIGAILVVLGIIGAFVLKPKASAAA